MKALRVSNTVIAVFFKAQNEFIEADFQRVFPIYNHKFPDYVKCKMSNWKILPNFVNVELVQAQYFNISYI